MKSIDKLVKTVAKLRSKNGCPWDKVQTHKTLKRYLIEEAYEAIDAIEKGNPKTLMDELGDVLLQVVLHSQIANEKKRFNLNKVAENINSKMVRRHPHVFGNVKAKTVEDVLVNWEKLKKHEKTNKNNTFEGIPSSLPALLKGLKVSKRAKREGFEWKKEKELWNAFKKELKELEQVAKGKKRRRDTLEEELGDLLFMIVNIARWYKLDPESSLNKGIKKFIKRYKKAKKLSNNKLSELSEKELDRLWQKAKK